MNQYLVLAKQQIFGNTYKSVINIEQKKLKYSYYFILSTSINNIPIN